VAQARPYVLINVAATADGKIDTIDRHGAAISTERDRRRVDALRASVDAVMVGPRTLLDEDPRLTVRSAELRAERVARGLPEQPAKVSLLAHPGLLRPDSRFVSSGAARIILFVPDAPAAAGSTGGAASPGANPAAPAVEVYRVGIGRVDLTQAMATLVQRGIARMLVEGGGSLNFELLRLGLVDEVQVFIAPLIFGGATAPTLADGSGGLDVRLTQTEAAVWEDGGVLLRYMVDRG
jgi:riboflavin-specific deaminase-like protein